MFNLDYQISIENFGFDYIMLVIVGFQVHLWQNICLRNQALFKIN